MKKNLGKKADIVILKDAKAEVMKKLLTRLSPGPDTFHNTFEKLFQMIGSNGSFERN